MRKAATVRALRQRRYHGRVPHWTGTDRSGCHPPQAQPEKNSIPSRRRKAGKEPRGGRRGDGRVDGVQERERAREDKDGTGGGGGGGGGGGEENEEAGQELVPTAARRMAMNPCMHVDMHVRVHVRAVSVHAYVYARACVCVCSSTPPEG